LLKNQIMRQHNPRAMPRHRTLLGRGWNKEFGGEEGKGAVVRPEKEEGGGFSQQQEKIEMRVKTSISARHCAQGNYCFSGQFPEEVEPGPSQEKGEGKRGKKVRFSNVWEPFSNSEGEELAASRSTSPKKRTYPGRKKRIHQTIGTKRGRERPTKTVDSEKKAASSWQSRLQRGIVRRGSSRRGLKGGKKNLAGERVRKNTIDQRGERRISKSS